MPIQKRNGLLRINLETKLEVIEKIKKKLGDNLLEKFRETPFGHFLDFAITNQSSQLLMHLIQKQYKSKSSKELNFLIGGRVIRFGLREFALITGPNCGPLPKITKDDIERGEGGYIKDMYFDGESKLMRIYINVGFKVD